MSAMFCMPFQRIREIYVNGERWEGTWRVETVSTESPCMPGQACGPFLVLEDCTTWPTQTLSRPLSDACTWAIVADTGCAPPPHILRQTEKLAYELLKSECDPDNCALPDNTKSMSRKGLTVEFDNEKFGLPILDAAVKKWECKPADFETATDPASTVRHHRQWLGNRSDLDAALTALGL